MDATDIGVQFAQEGAWQRSREDNCSVRRAARRLLHEGLSQWVWPDCLTREQVAEVEAAAEQQLRNLGGC